MTEKKKSIILIALLAAAGTVWYVDTRVGTIRGPSSSLDRTYTPLKVDSLALRGDKLARSRNTEYKSNGRDLFTEVIAPVVPKSSTVPDHPYVAQGPVEPPPPEPPKLPANVKFYGYGTVPNGTSKRAFLTDGDDVIIVSEGDTLLGRYRIVRIGNANLEFEEVTTGMRGTAPLEEQAAPPA